MGLQAQEILDRFVPQLDRQAQQRFSQAVSAAECEILRTGRGSTLFPGVRSLLETLRGRGLRLFIVSNCQTGYIEAFLEAYGLAPLIEGFEHPTQRSTVREHRPRRADVRPARPRLCGGRRRGRGGSAQGGRAVHPRSLRLRQRSARL